MDRKIVYHAPLSAEQRQHLATHGWVIDDNGNMLNPEQVAALDAQRAENDAARQRRLAAEAGRKAEADQRRQAELDLALAPTKDRRRHEWLANHPDRTANDFERVWRDHLRPLAVAELEEQRTEQGAAALVRSGQYV